MEKIKKDYKAGLVTLLISTALFLNTTAYANIDKYSLRVPLSGNSEEGKRRLQSDLEANSAGASTDITVVSPQEILSGSAAHTDQYRALEFEDVNELSDPTALLKLNEERIAAFVETLDIEPVNKWYTYILLSAVMDRAINQKKQFWHTFYIKRIEFIPELEGRKNIFRITRGTSGRAWHWGDEGLDLKKGVQVKGKTFWWGYPESRGPAVNFDNQGRFTVSLEDIETAGYGIMDILNELSPINREEFLHTPVKGSTPLNQSKVSILFWLNENNPQRVAFPATVWWMTEHVDPFYFNRIAIMNNHREFPIQLLLEDFLLSPSDERLRYIVEILYKHDSLIHDAERYLGHYHSILKWQLADIKYYNKDKKGKERLKRMLQDASVAIDRVLGRKHRIEYAAFERFYWGRNYRLHFTSMGQRIVYDMLHAKVYTHTRSLEEDRVESYTEDIKEELGSLICIYENFYKWSKRYPNVLEKIARLFRGKKRMDYLYLKAHPEYNPEYFLIGLHRLAEEMSFSIDEIRKKGAEFFTANKGKNAPEKDLGSMVRFEEYLSKRVADWRATREQAGETGIVALQLYRQRGTAQSDL